TKTALIAALFTACSAYGLAYGRDAKMYMPAWTAATLMIACLLWWAQTKRFVAWEAWVAAGVAAGGLHAASLLLLPLAPIVVLTQKGHRWSQAVLMVIGICIIV